MEMESITSWKFLDEPLYRWAIFLVAISLISGVWKMIIDGYIKG
jgi:hypothetical protein